MIALAFSGGGNRGPLQIGAMEALFAADIWPSFVVGTSAGAINAVYLAARGEPSCTVELAEIWRQLDKSVVYPGTLLQILWRVVSGRTSLYPNRAIRDFISAHLPAGVATFADLQMECYLTASDLVSGALYLYPHSVNREASLVDAMLASAAVPGVHPPLVVGSAQLVDGGVVANVPASIAIDRGATEIYVVNVGYGGDPMDPATSILGVLGRTYTTLIAQSLFADLARAADNQSIHLHHIHIPAFDHLPFNDFSQVDGMVAAGRAATEAYLADPRPFSYSGAGLHTPPGSARSTPPPVPGAVVYRPAYARNRRVGTRAVR